MARTSAILLVAFVLAVVLSVEVQADTKCMRKCNSKCLKLKQKKTSVSCGVGCLVECLDYGNQKNQFPPETEAKLAVLKKKALDGSIKSEDVQDQLLDIAKHMMLLSSIKLHDHENLTGEKPVAAPRHLKPQAKDITDDDDN